LTKILVAFFFFPNIAGQTSCAVAAGLGAGRKNDDKKEKNNQKKHLES
jgi:hypothetical protein